MGRFLYAAQKNIPPLKLPLYRFHYPGSLHYTAPHYTAPSIIPPPLYRPSPIYCAPCRGGRGHGHPAAPAAPAADTAITRYIQRVCGSIMLWNTFKINPLVPKMKVRRLARILCNLI